MDNWLLTVIIVTITYIVLKAFRYKNYFKQYGIPHPSEIPFLGSMGAGFVLQRKHISETMKEVYNIDKEAKYAGCHVFFTPIITIRDLDLIKSVLVKNFDHFADHKDFVDEAADPLFGKNLAFLNGERWRDVRNLLSPAFTSSKMRAMHVLMSKCAENFAEKLIEQYVNKDMEMKDIFTRYANDVIATCAFGIEVDSLKDPNNEFYVHGRNSTKTTPVMMFKFLLFRISPSLCKKLGVRVISKLDTDFFINLIETTMKAREERGITRPDMLQLMMDARGKTKELDILEMTAQAFVFFLGGFETTAGQMCLMAHELAVNTDIQENLQAEIDGVMEKTNGKPTYEAVNNMPYLDAIFSETLRKHPLPFLGRMCSKEFELPPALPGSKPYVMKPGSEILIPVSSIHSNPEYYEEPEKFDPDRFLDKKAMNSDVTSLGFGMGPRVCIGNRFAILETKVLFTYLLHKCSFVTTKKTCVPLVYQKSNFAPLAKDGCWLSIKLRD